MYQYFIITIIVLIYSVPITIQYKNCSVKHNTANYWLVDCSSLNLNTLPDYLQLHPVRNLTFVNNNLNSSITFKSWSDLEHLNIAFNNLSYISNETFQGLDRLLYLNVSYNNIQSLSGDNFYNVPYLKILDISGNVKLGKDSVILEKGLNLALYRGLRRLFMSSLMVETLSQHFFDRANELYLLDLSNNSLKVLPNFPKLLNILDISNNTFSTLTMKPFYYSRNITTIIAEWNLELENIEGDTFQTMQYLRTVSLKGCKHLDKISYETFYFNKNLQYLSIASCNFKTLPTVMKHIFMYIDVVDLQDNPWHCTPAIKWFRLMNMPTNMTENLRCSTPTDAALIDYYAPQHHHEILKVLLGVLVIFVFIFFGAGLFFAYHMERKRKLAHPYMPLGRSGAPISSPIYISTVV